MQAGKRQRGFTLVAVLAAMLLLALATQGVVTVLSQQAQREREAELLRLGQAIAQAIGAYYESSPGSVKNWPRSLEDLTEDRRFLDARRYLREIYPDPITRSVDWGLLPSGDGGVAGVFSRSEIAPIRSAAVDLGSVTLPAASRYSDWKFTYAPAPRAATRSN